MTNEDDPLLDTSVSVLTSYNGESGLENQPQQVEQEHDDHLSRGESASKASLKQTSINIAKNCIGTGTLALPYASSQGGFVFSIIGLALIAQWNIYSVDRLIKCELLMQKMAIVPLTTEIAPSSSANTTPKRHHHRSNSSKQPHIFENTNNHTTQMNVNEKEHIRNQKQICPKGTTTFGKVAFYSFGSWGLNCLDLIMVLLFIGVLLSCFVLITELLEAAHFTSGSYALDTLMISVIIIILSSVPDLSVLHVLSAAGILAVIIAFIVILSYGILEYGLIGFTDIQWGNLWPHSVTGISNWFGVAVFSFAIVPITFNIQDSMTNPDQMSSATKTALRFVFVLYIIVGNGTAIIFAPGNKYYFEGQVLAHLPSSWISTLVRFAMALTTIATTPFLVIPCGEVVTSKLGLGIHPSRAWSIATRATLCMISAMVSVLIPDFVSVVKFLGCCAVSMVGFVFPPLFHIVLSRKSKKGAPANKGTLAELMEKGAFQTRHGNESDHVDDHDTITNLKTNYQNGHMTAVVILTNSDYERMTDVVMLTISIAVTVITSYLSLLDGKIPIDS